MQINFTLQMPADEDDAAFLSETAIAASAVALQKLIDDDSQGQVLITHDGKMTVIEDSLGVLIRAFCLDAVVTVARDDYAKISHHKHAGDITLSLNTDSDTLRLCDTDIDGEVSLPATAFLKALLACGERWVTLVKTGFAGEATATSYLAELDGKVKAARIALLQVGK